MVGTREAVEGVSPGRAPPQGNGRTIPNNAFSLHAFSVVKLETVAA